MDVLHTWNYCQAKKERILANELRHVELQSCDVESLGYTFEIEYSVLNGGTLNDFVSLHVSHSRLNSVEVAPSGADGPWSLNHSEISKVTFEHINPKYFHITNSYIIDCTFDGIKFDLGSFQNTSFRECVFRNIDMGKVSTSECDFEYCEFDSVFLETVGIQKGCLFDDGKVLSRQMDYWKRMFPWRNR